MSNGKATSNTKPVNNVKPIIKEEIKVNEEINVMANEEKSMSNEKNLEMEEINVKEMLEKQPKVKIEIPENPLNPNEVVPIGYNGVIYAIPTGQEFEVPQGIYNTWKYSHEATKEANKKMDKILNREIEVL